MYKKFNNIIAYTNTLAPFNEDSCYATENFMFVVDGATGLYKTNYTPFTSDAVWLSQYISNYLKEELSNIDKSLGEIVSDAVKSSVNAFESYYSEQKEVGYPSATGSIVRINENKLEYLVIGDSPILIEDKNGTVTELFEPQLRKLDKSVIADMVEHAGTKGLHINESIEFVREKLRHNRGLANTPEGYHSISKDISVGEKALTGEFLIKDIKTVAILSDGFAQHFELLKCSENATDFMSQLKSKSINELYSEITASQNSDPHFNQYPRIKHSDDASIVVGQL